MVDIWYVCVVGRKIDFIYFIIMMERQKTQQTIFLSFLNRNRKLLDNAWNKLGSLLGQFNLFLKLSQLNYDAQHQFFCHEMILSRSKFPDDTIFIQIPIEHDLFIILRHVSWPSQIPWEHR